MFYRENEGVDRDYVSENRKCDVYRLACLLQHRSAGLTGAERCEPLSVLMRELGYDLTPDHPYGRKTSRVTVLRAVEELAKRGDWRLEVRDVSDLDDPLGKPSGLFADDVWVSYRPAREK